MSILENMIIDAYGKKHKYLINTSVAIHAQEKACNDILKQFPLDADITFEKVI